MKKQLLTFIAASLFTVNIVTAQTSVNQAAAYAETLPSSACLACPGSIWNNELNVSVADGVPSDIGLMQNGSCFQSTCFYSRSLSCSQFGFSVPTGATILGIEVNILRNAPAINIIKDTSVTIYQNGMTLSSNYKSATVWPLAYTNELYGGNTNLWGLAWTPADINNPSTGILLSIYNLDPTIISGINVDYVSMTVYYSVTTGIVESQTSSPNSFSAYQSNSNAITCSFIASEKTNSKLSVFDLSGKLVYSKDLGLLALGNHQEIIPTMELQNGIYLVQYCEGYKIVSRKISIQK